METTTGLGFRVVGRLEKKIERTYYILESTSRAFLRILEYIGVI